MECMIELGSEALEIKIPEGCESGSVRCNGLDNNPTLPHSPFTIFSVLMHKLIFLL